VNDAVDRIILERQALDRGFPGSVMVSVAGHSFLAGGFFIASLLVRPEPPLRVMDGFVAEVPRGGGGSRQEPGPAPVPAPVPQPPQTEAPAPPQDLPPSVQKPPKEEPPRVALPDPELKHHRKKETPPPPAPGGHGKPASRAAVRGGMTGGGTSSQPFGIEFGPAGPGMPNGTTTGGDWYIATVQQKIWMIWTQQIKDAFTQPIGVSFTILANGDVDGESVRLTQPSGSTLLDLAAKRAVMSAGPFGPLPKEYGTNRYTIEAIFKPTS
jgi:protein TonB